MIFANIRDKSHITKKSLHKKEDLKLFYDKGFNSQRINSTAKVKTKSGKTKFFGRKVPHTRARP